MNRKFRYIELKKSGYRPMVATLTIPSGFDSPPPYVSLRDKSTERLVTFMLEDRSATNDEVPVRPE